MFSNPNGSSLDSDELSRVKAKYGKKNQLAFAVLLKFFQSEGYFPSGSQSIPASLINCLATQLGHCSQSIDAFNYKDNYTHPVYKALNEIGNAVRTLFLCRYLTSEALRVEINEALNIVERLNGIAGFIFYGKLGEICTNKKDEQSLAVACLHLLQVCMVYINTLLIQEVLSDKTWANKLTKEDFRALSTLIHAHINPYGLFPLDLLKRLIIEINKEEETQYAPIQTDSRKAESEAYS